MGHLSPKSADPYFHPDEKMAAEVRQKIITDLSQITQNLLENRRTEEISKEVGKAKITGPCCDGKGFIYK